MWKMKINLPISSRASLVILAGLSSFQGVAGEVSVARKFYEQPVVEQLRTLRQHPLPEQLDLYFFGNQVRHPPAIYLARCFALNGAAAVALLDSKLGVDSDDLAVRDITALLATIDAMGTYDVAGNEKLMTALRRRVENMKDDAWRDTAQKKLASVGNSRSERAAKAPECGE